MKTRAALTSCARFFCFVLDNGAGRTAANPLSLFNGSCRPQRILLAAKCYEGRYVWCGGLFCGKTLRGSVYLARRFTLFAGYGGRWLWPRSVFKGTYHPRRVLPCGKTLRCATGLAWRFVLFAGFVQFLLTNKNCTRAVDEFYLADKLSPPALVRDAFYLR